MICGAAYFESNSYKIRVEIEGGGAHFSSFRDRQLDVRIGIDPLLG